MRNMLLVVLMALAIFGAAVLPSEAKQRGQGKSVHRTHHTKLAHHAKKTGKHGKAKAKKVKHHRKTTGSAADSGTAAAL